MGKILRIAEQFDFPARKNNFSDYICVPAESLKIALRDKEQLIGDSDYANNPIDRILPDAYCQEQAARICLRKIIKTRAHFSNDDAATKLIWLALRNITAD